MYLLTGCYRYKAGGTKAYLPARRVPDNAVVAVPCEQILPLQQTALIQCPLIPDLVPHGLASKAPQVIELGPVVPSGLDDFYPVDPG